MMQSSHLSSPICIECTTSRPHQSILQASTTPPISPRTFSQDLHPITPPQPILTGGTNVSADQRRQASPATRTPQALRPFPPQYIGQVKVKPTDPTVLQISSTVNQPSRGRKSPVALPTSNSPTGIILYDPNPTRKRNEGLVSQNTNTPPPCTLALPICLQRYV